MALATAEKTTPVQIESEENELIAIHIGENNSFVDWRVREECGVVSVKKVEVSSAVQAALMASPAFQAGLTALVNDTHSKIDPEWTPE